MSKLPASFRRNLATLFVALYALCVLAPHAAMAFTQANNAAHCLTQSESAPHQHVAATHHHDDGSAHSHTTSAGNPDRQDNNEPPLACCGLFSASAIVAEFRVAYGNDSPGESIVPALQRNLADHPPGRTIRPPIA